jgi:hypothetical protein
MDRLDSVLAGSDPSALSPAEIAAIVAAERQARRLEERAARGAAAMRSALEAAMRDVAAGYTRIVGSLRSEVPDEAGDSLRTMVRRVVTALATGLLSELPAVFEALRRAIEAGLRHGSRQPGGSPLPGLVPSPELLAVVDRLGLAVRADIDQALRLVNTGPSRSWRDASSLVGLAGRPVRRVDETARWASNQAVSEGARARAEHDGVPVLFLAERDACLTCLAYSGLVARPGESFPAGLTFGDPGTSTVKDPIFGPPLHPHCRCRVTPWYGTDPYYGIGPQIAPEMPAVLMREAQRSVFRGDSAYHSGAALMRAAARLLASPPGTTGLPETVKFRAARKVAAGRGAWRRSRR